MVSVRPETGPEHLVGRVAFCPGITVMKLKYLLPIIVLIVTVAVVALPASVNAQANPIQLSFTAEIEQLTIGDPVNIKATATYPAGYQVLFPDLPERWGSFEVRNQARTAARSNPDGSETATQSIQVALFGTGSFETPDYTITILNDIGQIESMLAPPVTLTVVPVLPPGSLQLKDIKPQTNLPWIVAWPVIPAGALLLAFLGLVVYMTAKWVRTIRYKASIKVDTRSPYEIAQDELVHIQRLDMPGQGLIKEHYTMVSDSVRRYLENAYEVAATDLTTDEVRRALRSSAITTEDSRDVINLLGDCDLVKFTALEPGPDTAREMTERARELVEMMTPWGSWSGKGGSK